MASINYIVIIYNIVRNFANEKVWQNSTFTLDTRSTRKNLDEVTIGLICYANHTAMIV